jgi:hypothetical protein
MCIHCREIGPTEPLPTNGHSFDRLTGTLMLAQASTVILPWTELLLQVVVSKTVDDSPFLEAVTKQRIDCRIWMQRSYPANKSRFSTQILRKEGRRWKTLQALLRSAFHKPISSMKITDIFWYTLKLAIFSLCVIHVLRLINIFKYEIFFFEIENWQK